MNQISLDKHNKFKIEKDNENNRYKVNQYSGNMKTTVFQAENKQDAIESMIEHAKMRGWF